MSVLSLLTAAAVFGFPAACAPDAKGTAALVTVHGFKDRVGNLRIVIYRANEEEFLASGRYVQRIDVPVTPSGEMTVCAPVPDAGNHVVVALHDRDKNGKMDPFKDGVGFSGNPRLGLAKPKIAAVDAQLSGVTPFRIELNYLQGLRVAPVRARPDR